MVEQTTFDSGGGGGGSGGDTSETQESTADSSFRGPDRYAPENTSPAPAPADGDDGTDTGGDEPGESVGERRPTPGEIDRVAAADDGQDGGDGTQQDTDLRTGPGAPFEPPRERMAEGSERATRQRVAERAAGQTEGVEAGDVAVRGPSSVAVSRGGAAAAQSGYSLELDPEVERQLIQQRVASRSTELEPGDVNVRDVGGGNYEVSVAEGALPEYASAPEGPPEAATGGIDVSGTATAGGRPSGPTQSTAFVPTTTAGRELAAAADEPQIVDPSLEAEGDELSVPGFERLRGPLQTGAEWWRQNITQAEPGTYVPAVGVADTALDRFADSDVVEQSRAGVFSGLNPGAAADEAVGVVEAGTYVGQGALESPEEFEERAGEAGEQAVFVGQQAVRGSLENPTRAAGALAGGLALGTGAARGVGAAARGTRRAGGAVRRAGPGDVPSPPSSVRGLFERPQFGRPPRGGRGRQRSPEPGERRIDRVEQEEVEVEVEVDEPEAVRRLREYAEEPAARAAEPEDFASEAEFERVQAIEDARQRLPPESEYPSREAFQRDLARALEDSDAVSERQLARMRGETTTRRRTTATTGAFGRPGAGQVAAGAFASAAGAAGGIAAAGTVQAERQEQPEATEVVQPQAEPTLPLFQQEEVQPEAFDQPTLTETVSTPTFDTPAIATTTTTTTTRDPPAIEITTTPTPTPGRPRAVPPLPGPPDDDEPAPEVVAEAERELSDFRSPLTGELLETTAGASL